MYLHITELSEEDVPKCVYIEIDEQRLEQRRVEICHDNQKKKFERSGKLPDSNIAEIKWPLLAEFNGENAYRLQEGEDLALAISIDLDHFESIWLGTAPNE